MARRYFGTDGVRGVVGEFLTAELVQRLGEAVTLWAGGGRVFVGRDTRGSGPELEGAFARGVVAAAGHALLGGVLPTPAVALAAESLGAVISASHNPPEYNGVKLFDGAGQKLTDAAEEEIEALLDAPVPGGGTVQRVHDAAAGYVRHVRDRFGSDLTGLRIGVDCGNGAYADIAPDVFRELGADVRALGTEPNGANINVGCGATDLVALSHEVVAEGCDLGVAFDGDGDRMLAVDAAGRTVDGDAILAILALHMGVDLVVVTAMTNLAFHRLMAEHGVRVVTTDVGDRYVLEALRREGGVLGGEQSGHVICLEGHVSGDGLAAALLLCRAVSGRSLAAAASVLTPYPQAKENVAVTRKELPDSFVAEVGRLNAGLDGEGRVLVRPSGTEPLIRVLAEAPSARKAAELCGTIAALVRRELG